jgi:transcriptional regulator with GAF, ATPase, and Fis domain
MAERKPASPPKGAENLERTWWLNWWLLVGASLVLVVGLSVAMRTLVPARFQRIWPWASTDDVLLAGVCILLVFFTVYLTAQQRATRKQIRELVARGERQSIQHYKRLVALLEISHMVGYQTDLQSVFDGITAACNDTFGSQWASLMLYEPEHMRLVVASCSGDITRNILGASRGLGEGVAGWVAKHQRPILLDADTKESDYPGLTINYQFVGQSMVVPIIVDGQLVGIISVASMDDVPSFCEEDLHTLRVFAESVGVSIRHAQEIGRLKGPVDEPDLQTETHAPRRDIDRAAHVE